MTQTLTPIPISTAMSSPLILEDISWEKYEQLLDIFAEYPAIRMTYDQGTLEIMTPLPEHERSSWILGRLIVILSEELDLEIIGLKSTTWRSKLKAVGKEADECFYIQNEAKMRGKVKIDLTVDPPPDLVIEIDLTHSFIDKMTIYTKLQVPEIWQYQKEKITIYLLNQDQSQYQESETSLAFPFFPVKELANFIKIDDQKGENAKMKEFRQWVRLQLSK
jgi:Uma2 family endonuclease